MVSVRSGGALEPVGGADAVPKRAALYGAIDANTSASLPGLTGLAK
jgi:hypothetical protein